MSDTYADTYVAALEQYGLIRATGDDALTFLQGQFGNDLNRVDSGRHQLNCYANPKGRLLAIFRIFLYKDTYYLRLPVELVDPTLQRLKMFVLRAKVALEDASDEWAGVGITGPDTATALEELNLGPIPTDVGDSTVIDNCVALNIPGVETRLEIYGPRSAVSPLTDKFQARCKSANAGHWMYDEILAGQPSVFLATREEFVPQMTNLQIIDGLSFKKGCYPGQEIVARMHYLGKLKRRMYRLVVDGDDAPTPGTDVYLADTDKPIGKIVDGRKIDTHPTVALAVLQIEQAHIPLLRIGSSAGPVATLATLPYEFESELQPE